MARLAQSVAVVFAAATFAFVCLQLAPGDPITALGEGVPAEIREQRRAVYGLNDPVLVQYGRWLIATVQGDLGWSIAQQRPVAAVLADALPNSLLLVVPAFTLAVLLGLALGAWQGVHARQRRDRITSMLLLVMYSIPEFWMALALLMLFAVFLAWLPVSGMTSDLFAYLTPAQQFKDRLLHLVLPVTSVLLFDLAALARFQRLSMMDTLEQPFVRTATANGIPGRRVHWLAWRASLLPIITLSGFLLPANLAGVVFIEQTFAWPGMGYVMLGAISKHDYDLVAGCVLVGSAMMAAGTFAAECLREWADPRLRRATSSRASAPLS